MGGQLVIRFDTIMPTVYRAMKRAPDDLPETGANSNQLGVRVPPNPWADVDLDANDHVILNGRGLSVVENWRRLPAHLIPKRLKPLFPGAAGNNSRACYKTGADAFGAGPIGGRLDVVLKTGNPRAGNIVPSQSMHRDQFQMELAATRNDWTVDES